MSSGTNTGRMGEQMVEIKTGVAVVVYLGLVGTMMALAPMWEVNSLECSNAAFFGDGITTITGRSSSMRAMGPCFISAAG